MSGNLLQTRVVSTSIFHWQVAVCNLASLALNRFVTSEGKYDFQRLFEVTKVCVQIFEQSESVVIFLSCFSWQVVTRNLNRIIDVNHYPVPEVPIIVLVLLPVSSSTKTKQSPGWVLTNSFSSLHQAEYSNKRHRPIGIGVQGLADAFILMRYPFESPEAQDLNRKIFETIYFGALTASCELAKRDGPYDTYEGSPVSKGVSALVTTSLICT